MIEIVNGIFSEAFWYVAPIIITVTTAIAGVINQGFKIENGTVKQLISWGVASVLSVCVWALGLLKFGDPEWLGVVSLCVVTSLSSNGFYDINVIKEFINTWFRKKDAETKK